MDVLKKEIGKEMLDELLAPLGYLERKRVVCFATDPNANQYILEMIKNDVIDDYLVNFYLNCLFKVIGVNIWADELDLQSNSIGLYLFLVFALTTEQIEAVKRLDLAKSLEVYVDKKCLEEYSPQLETVEMQVALLMIQQGMPVPKSMLLALSRSQELKGHAATYLKGRLIELMRKPTPQSYGTHNLGDTAVFERLVGTLEETSSGRFVVYYENGDLHYGGFVEDTAYVETIMNINMNGVVIPVVRPMIGPNVEIYDYAKVSGNANVYDYAEIYDWAQVSGNAQVYGDAKVREDAQVYGAAKVYGDAQVYGNAKVTAHVFGNAEIYGDAKIYKYAQVYGDAEIYENAKITGYAQVFGGARIFGNAKVHKFGKVTGNTQVGGDRIVEDLVGF